MKKWVFVIVGFGLIAVLASFWMGGNEQDEEDFEEGEQAEWFQEDNSSEDEQSELGSSTMAQEEENSVQEEENAKRHPPSIARKSSPRSLDNLSADELESMRVYFEKLNKEWRTAVRNLIIKDFAMTEEEYNAYAKVRKEYEQRKARTFFEFYEREGGREKELGQNATEYEEQIGRHLREEHRNRLRSLFGEGNFERYLRLLNSFNERIQREQEPIKGVSGIDI